MVSWARETTQYENRSAPLPAWNRNGRQTIQVRLAQAVMVRHSLWVRQGKEEDWLDCPDKVGI